MIRDYEEGLFIPRVNQDMPHGVIGLANDARIVEGNYQVALTDYAVGFMDSAPLAQLVDFLAPRVPVTRRFEYVKYINAEAFLSDAPNDDLRAIGGDFKRVEYQSQKATGATDNRGLTINLDRDQYDGSASYEQIITQRLIDRLLRNRLRRVFAAMSAAAVNTAKTWDTTAGKDPDKDVQTELLLAQTASGIRPNRVIYGDTAWDKRVLSTRVQNLAGAYDSVSLAEDQLARRLRVSGVMVDTSRFQSSAIAKSEIVGTAVLAFAGNDSPLPSDFSNAKVFISNTQNGQGAPVRVYREEKMKSVSITVETYDLVSIVSALGLRKLTIS